MKNSFASHENSQKPQRNGGTTIQFFNPEKLCIEFEAINATGRISSVVQAFAGED